MGAPREVAELAERFDRNVEAYRAGRINEENTKVSYINPLLEALGWDVRNAQGRPGGYQDVVFEDSVKIGGGTKAPDYGFYVGGARKFFLEAKKPSVNLADDVNPAVQLRRYAWTARHPVGILTDFEELAVYDCRVEPGKEDQPATARALYLRYDEYEDRWDELADLFGRDAVSAGSLERFAETAKTRRGTETVDRAFLREIEGWRQTLAKDLARRNDINGRQLNYAVQTTIDRIIFLRMAEDRGIEEYGRLLALTNGPNVYGRMLGLFREADDRYNSGLFHFRSERGRLEEPDDLTPHLSIDDAALSGIIRGLYYPESPYEFSVLPVDVLGQVYEQFLGSVIRLDSPDSAVVEAKPEVRKAGGVYYTPTYIVDYIVGNTLGKLLEGKRPGPRGGASRLKIVDPACGSGSFLIGAYEYLLDWHRDRYVEDGPDKHHKRLYEGPGGQWLLTIEEKKRILVNNIHGVDIDPQAVEVTKLSLLLKVLEGETDESITRQLSLFAAERALPDLDANIKCGNSLIGPDFYDEPQMSLLEEEEHYRINVFDWEAAFPHVYGGDDPGFDTVIGNPPYGGLFSKPELQYLYEKYPETRRFSDSYCFFLVAALRLLKVGERMSFIVPNTFCDLENCEAFRYWLLTNYKLQNIWQTGWAFKAAVVDTLVAVVSEESASEEHNVQIQVDERQYTRTAASFIANNLHKIDYRNTEQDRQLLHEIEQTTRAFGELVSVKAGVKMYERGKGTPPQTQGTMQERPFSTKSDPPEDWKPLYRGGDISRYSLRKPKEFVNYGPWLAAPREPRLFLSPKILMRRTDDRLLATVEQDSAICVNSCHVIKLREAVPSSPSYWYLLGLLNSRLIQRMFEVQNPQMVSKVFAEIKVVYVERLPIRTIDFSDAEDA